MLAIPIKRCARLEWAPPLKAYLSSHYSQREVDAYGSQLDLLDQARDQSVASTCKTATTSSAGASDAASLDAISKLAEYTQMLLNIESRLDFSDESSGAPSLSFSWNDAFKPTKKITRHDIAFERVCVLFNAGAIHSFAGIGQDRSTNEGIKSSCQHFQRAAGIYHFLETDLLANGLPGGSLTSDLRPEGLRMLKTVMLAQAQACFYEKAVKGKMKAAILTKLAMQASAWYKEAMDQCSAPTMTTILDASWSAHLNFQRLCFAASAKYWHSKVVHANADSTGSGYGDEVGWLFSSENSCQEAIRSAQAGSLPASMLNTVNALLGAIRRELARAVDDNNSIYMESVPRNLSVDGLSKYPLAKTLPLEDSFVMPCPELHPGANILESLVPVAVHKAVTRYGDLLAEFITKLSENAKKASSDARRALDDAGLPASIESSMEGSGVGYPDASWSRLQSEVLDHGGVAQLGSMYQANVSSAAELDGILSKCAAVLDAEERDDAQGRQTHGASWAMQPSAQVSGHLRNDIDRYRGLLQHAKSADGQVGSMMQSNASLLQKLELPRRELDKLYPGATGATSGQSNVQDPQLVQAREDLSSLLVSMGLLLGERDKVVGELGAIKQQENGPNSSFAKLLSARGMKAAERMVAEDDRGESQELKQLMKTTLDQFQQKNPLVQKINASLGEQRASLAEILHANSTFLNLLQHNELSSKRQAMLSEMDTCIARFTELKNNIAEGQGFYKDLVTRCNQLLTTCSDHCFVRTEQRKQLLDELKSKGSSVSAAAVPPSYSASASAVPPTYTAVGAPAPPYQAAGTQPPPYPAGGVPPNIALGTPVGAPSAGVEDAKLNLMRAMVPGVSDDVLRKYLDGAGGDVNTAVNHYLNQT